MDKRITFRFYNVTKPRQHRFNFGDVLSQIGAIQPPRDRERQLATDYYVRAEIVEAARGSVHGEFTRIQRTNFPSEVDANGRRPLSTRSPLGHGVVFRYLPGTSQIGLQYDPRTLSPSKISYYVGQMIDGADFEFTPIVREDIWEKFNQGDVRKISIGIANPTHLGVVERGGAQSIAQSFRDMGEAYEAPKINIELSMGNRKGALAERVRGMVRHFRTQAVQDQVDISSMKAKIKQQGERAEDLDLLQDILSVKDNLELSDNDPERNYQVKLAALREKMHEWL